jgi:hypothetical protein
MPLNFLVTKEIQIMSATASDVTSQAATPVKKKAEGETVKMTDGREVFFSGLNPEGRGFRRLLKDYILNEDGSLSHIVLDFRNGDTRQITIPEELLGRFAGHGAIQKFGDNLAGMKPAEGQSEIDIEDMVYETDQLNDQIQRGEWSAEREGDGVGGTSILIKALMLYGGGSLETVKAFLADKDQKFKRSLRANDKRKNAAGVSLKSIVDKLEAEKAAKAIKVDTNEALDELESMSSEAGSEAE